MRLSLIGYLRLMIYIFIIILYIIDIVYANISWETICVNRWKLLEKFTISVYMLRLIRSLFARGFIWFVSTSDITHLNIIDISICENIAQTICVWCYGARSRYSVLVQVYVCFNMHMLIWYSICMSIKYYSYIAAISISEINFQTICIHYISICLTM